MPDDADQGFSQRIFYFHVPVALTTYACFAYARGLRGPATWRGAIPRGTCARTSASTSARSSARSCWSPARSGRKISWGVWWNWSDRQLNVFLILFLFYCAYFMLRFSLEEGERRATFSSVYVLLGVGLVPLSILAVRIAQTLIHPTVFTSEGTNMPGSLLPHVPRRPRRDARARRPR